MANSTHCVEVPSLKFKAFMPQSQVYGFVDNIRGWVKKRYEEGVALYEGQDGQVLVRVTEVADRFGR